MLSSMPSTSLTGGNPEVATIIDNTGTELNGSMMYKATSCASLITCFMHSGTFAHVEMATPNAK